MALQMESSARHAFEEKFHDLRVFSMLVTEWDGSSGDR
jgi:hypothetical protein